MSEKRDKIRHIAFTESETSKISEYAKHYNMTSSEFIRQAINDKIRNIENPETSKLDNKPDLFKEFITEQKELNERFDKLENLITTRLTTINGIKNGYKSLTELISDGTYKENLTLKADKIYSLMENKKGYTPKELNKITGFDLKSIDLALTNNQETLFQLNNNGRWVKI